MLPLLFLLPTMEPSFCGDKPTAAASESIGSTSDGRVEGAKAFVDTPGARIMPKHHKARCLNYGTPRLIDAITKAGARVQALHPRSPPLGVGNIGKARGGPIEAFSRSHQAGRDADLMFYLVDDKGEPVAAEELVTIGDDLKGLDVPRTWTLVQALLENKEIEVRWLFVSLAIKRALLEEGKQRGAPKTILRRAEEVLHQPSDAPPHDDHIHLRITCAPSEKRCR